MGLSRGTESSETTWPFAECEKSCDCVNWSVCLWEFLCLYVCVCGNSNVYVNSSVCVYLCEFQCVFV